MNKYWESFKLLMWIYGSSMCKLINPNDRVNNLFLDEYKRELKKLWKSTK